MVGHFSTASSVSGHWAHASDCTTIKKHAPFMGGVFFFCKVRLPLFCFYCRRVCAGSLCSDGAPPCFCRLPLRRLRTAFYENCFASPCLTFLPAASLPTVRLCRQAGGACVLRGCYPSSSTLGFTVTASRISASIAAIL